MAGKFFIFLCLFLMACSGGGLNLGYYPDPNASRDEFIYCHGYNCTSRTYAHFTDKQWQSIKRIFRYKPKSAADERTKIAAAIAKMESYAGHLVGTENDGPKAPISRQSFYELDCIDETINTNKFLKFLEEENLFKFHTLGKPVYRGLSQGMYPHNSATVIEKETGQVHVIDSYIYANGEKPDIRTKESWMTTRIEDLKNNN